MVKTPSTFFLSPVTLHQPFSQTNHKNHFTDDWADNKINIVLLVICLATEIETHKTKTVKGSKEHYLLGQKYNPQILPIVFFILIL